MKKIFNENFFAILIAISMISLPLLQIIGLKYRSRFFYQEELLSGIGIFIIIVLVLYYIFLKRNKIEIPKKLVLSDIFMIVSILFCIISIIFSKDLEKSLTGEYMYSETPLQVLAYFAIFFMCTLISKKENKQSIFEIFIFLAIIESIIAFLQNFSLWPVPPLFDSYSHINEHMAFGLTEHCNFFAAICTILVGICSSKFIYEKEKKKSFLFLLFSIITCLSSLFTYTRLSWLGLFSIIFALMFLNLFNYIINKNKKESIKYLIKLIILIINFIVCFLIIEFNYSKISNEIETSKKELYSITSNNSQKSNTSNSSNNFKKINIDRLGTNRGLIWKVGFSALQKYPFTGVGFDNYRYSFKIYPQNFGWSQNKGHNEYLHIFVTQGVFSGINYLLFAFYCCFFPFKKILTGDSEFAKSDLTKIFLIALLAYFVQALFNSSVTNVAPYKWILMGLLLPRVEQKNLFEIKLFKKN